MISDLIAILNSKLGSRLPTVGYSPDMDPIENYNSEVPAALFLYGDRKFQKSIEHTTDHQENTTTITILLIAPVDQIYNIEIEIIEALMGHVHDDNHSGLYAVECQTVDAKEDYFTRRIILGSDNHIFSK